MHWPINDHCTLVMVLSNTQSLFWIWASKLLLWRRFDFAFLGQKKKTEMGMVDFSFSSQKVWNLDVSISSRIMRFVFKISLSLLEIGDLLKKFYFSSRNLRKENPFLFLFSKLENLFSNFSFSSRNWGKEFQVSLSLLEIGEKNIKFLFLFSIGLFGLSSMTAPKSLCKYMWMVST